MPPDQVGLLVLALETGFPTLAHTDPDTIPEEAFLNSLDLLNQARTALAQQTMVPTSLGADQSPSGAADFAVVGAELAGRVFDDSVATGQPWVKAIS
ncbi:hypothetical protein ACFXG4_30230 [Nocardia sp. NPDC059246]|uniref:hypothetical protein n=1 Tax=unclassified Nocardia TaxID=2637762 RepID=UPI0036920A7F